MGSWSATTIGRVIADLKPLREERPQARRYEMAGAMVMWSEDGTTLKDSAGKKELLLLQDERARYTLNRRLSAGPAKGEDVASYLKEAFQQHGAPLVLKQDNDSALNSPEVQRVCDEWGVVLLNSPPGYPPFNGKKERRFRDVKSFVRALLRHRVGSSLEEQVNIALDDLDHERPRPVLGGRTAREVFDQDRLRLPNRQLFLSDVEITRCELEAQAGSRQELANARRRAVMEVLLRYSLLIWNRDVSTNSQAKIVTK
jgi:transposase InsO family protein